MMITTIILWMAKNVVLLQRCILFCDWSRQSLEEINSGWAMCQETNQSEFANSLFYILLIVQLVPLLHRISTILTSNTAGLCQ